MSTGFSKIESGDVRSSQGRMEDGHQESGCLRERGQMSPFERDVIRQLCSFEMQGPLTKVNSLFKNASTNVR